MSRMVTF